MSPAWEVYWSRDWGKKAHDKKESRSCFVAEKSSGKETAQPIKKIGRAVFFALCRSKGIFRLP